MSRNLSGNTGCRVPALFDVNGRFGRPAGGGSDFPVLLDWLTHMNRLGISRSLVWNTESTLNHALAGNESLLAEICRTPGAKGRIFPALTVSPLMFYEREGVTTLAKQLETGRCRALRFHNVMGHLALMQLEPVLRRLKGPKPFIVLKHDQASVGEVLEFAKTFPDIRVVLTEVMWTAVAGVFDLMRRRQNVLCDTSWLHSFGAIEMIVKHFGANRLVFGIGHKSHNGAAVAALARANITAAQRRQVAHANLDQLSGLGVTPAVTTRWTANKFWPRFLQGGTLGTDVVDAHGHLGPSGGYVLEHQEERAQIRAGLEVMDRIGIRIMLVSGMQAILGAPVEGNALLETRLRPYADRFLGYVAFNPIYAGDLIPKLDTYFGGSFFKGFKTLCAYWGVKTDDPRFKPMWAYANRYRLPILAHTWGSEDVLRLGKIAPKYPKAHFLIGHSGGSLDGRVEAERLVRERANVHLEWCGSFCCTIPWEDTLRNINPRQVVFGTDAMAHDFNWELGRLLSLDVPDRTLAAILGANMRRILAGRLS